MKLIPINDIQANTNNPRIIKNDKFAKLVQSLKDLPEMATVRPIVVNADMVVLGGNMRLKAMKEAGWKEVPVEVVDWDEEKQRQFIIKDNVGFGEWDWDVLANEWDNEFFQEWGLDVPYLNEIVDEDDFVKRFNNINDANCLYPIVPYFDEDHELFIIVCDNAIDGNWLREKLKMQKMKSYKSTELSKSNIVHVNDLKDVL